MVDPHLVLDYRLGNTPLANPDGTVPATVSGTSPSPGPGLTIFGQIDAGMHFDGSSWAGCSPDPSAISTQQFCIRLMMRVTDPVTDRMNLFEGSNYGLSLHVMPTAGVGQFRILATIDNERNGWVGVDSLNRRTLHLNQWYRVELAFHYDTLGLFIDGGLVGVTALPNAAPTLRTEADCWLGAHPDRTRWFLEGDIALAQLWTGIPDWPGRFGPHFDKARGGPEWQIRLKENLLFPDFTLGPRSGDIVEDIKSGMSLQRYDGATIGYGVGFPAAHLMCGAIRERWERASLGELLGVLTSDETDAMAEGSRRNTFERGVIYWSADTGAWEIIGRMAINYEILGGSTSVLGLPTAEREMVTSGRWQQFEHGRMYQRDFVDRAYEVHGAILEKYLLDGGLDKYGFPISDEEEILETGSGLMFGAPATGARRSRFENGTIFWSEATGAHSVQGDILNEYNLVGGPGLPFNDQFSGLGLPTTDETDWPSWAGPGRCSMFEHGSILWRAGSTRVCRPFQIRVGLIQTQEDEGVGQGQNDLYFKISVSANGVPVFTKRIPESGSFGGNNGHDLGLLLDPLFTPNNPELRIALHIEVWDEDDGLGFDDDHLGTFGKELNIANGWGLYDDPTGQFVAAGVGKIKRLEWSVQPRQAPKMPKDFWEARNRGTPILTYEQYAAAFTDIDDDPEWGDPSDWSADDLFTDRIEKMASGGNCFGMCTEALYAWANRGLGLPLARFVDATWPQISNQINLKQIYWLASDVISRYAQQVEDKISPLEVYERTRERSLAGEPSVVVLWSGTDYAGAVGHAVIPIDWVDNGVVKTMMCFDPNQGNARAQLNIDVNRNAWSAISGGLSFGSLNFVPWSDLDHRQCSPVWDPTLLMLALLIVVVGNDAATVSMTDTAGGNLWMPENPTRERGSGRGQFAPIPAPEGSFSGEILVRRVLPLIKAAQTSPGLFDVKVLDLKQFQFAPVRESEHFSPVTMVPRRLIKAIQLAQLPEASDDIDLRDLMHGIQATETPELAALGAWMGHQSSARGADFVHTMKGLRSGRFQYMARWRLTSTSFESPIGNGEHHKLEAKGLMDRMPLHKLTTERDKQVLFEQTVRIGRGTDFARIKIDKLPCRAAQPLSVSIRPGVAAVDIISSGDRVDVPVSVEVWRGGDRREQQYITTVEGGARFSLGLHQPELSLSQASISTMFGSPGPVELIEPVI